MDLFEFSDETIEELHKLKGFYCVDSISATLQRALAIASILAEFAGEDGSISVLKPGTSGMGIVKINQRYLHQRR